VAKIGFLRGTWLVINYQRLLGWQINARLARWGGRSAQLFPAKMPSGDERLTLQACGSRSVVAAASKRRLIVPFTVAVKHQSYQPAPNYK
jgi:hypothetical protein